MDQGEIIKYQPDNSRSQLEVRIEEETVWLTQALMVELFDSSIQNISLHIKNVFKEGELNQTAIVKEYLTVQLEGLRRVQRSITFHNLDVIISVGYRVKSQDRNGARKKSVVKYSLTTAANGKRYNNQ